MSNPEVVDVVPPAASDFLIRRKMVVIHGLQSKPHLNGRCGLIQRALPDGRYAVNLHEVWDDPNQKTKPKALLSLKRENLDWGKADEDEVPFHVCDGCGLSYGDKFLMKCAKCRRANYCSKECQSKNWKEEHKFKCKTLRESRKSKDDELSSIQDPEERRLARLARAGRFLDKDDGVGAERELRQALEENGHVGTPAIYCTLGKALVCQERPRDALKMYQKAIDCAHPFADAHWVVQAHNLKGVILATSIKDMKGAIASFRASLRLSPDDPHTKHWIGVCEKCLATGVLDLSG